MFSSFFSSKFSSHVSEEKKKRSWWIANTHHFACTWPYNHCELIVSHSPGSTVAHWREDGDTGNMQDDTGCAVPEMRCWRRRHFRNRMIGDATADDERRPLRDWDGKVAGRSQIVHLLFTYRSFIVHLLFTYHSLIVHLSFIYRRRVVPLQELEGCGTLYENTTSEKGKEERRKKRGKKGRKERRKRRIKPSTYYKICTNYIKSNHPQMLLSPGLRIQRPRTTKLPTTESRSFN